MSDTMERDKVEGLTAKEREEEEEMKRELLDMKMYEAWYTYQDMKDILGFINESKDMANKTSDLKKSQEESLHISNEHMTAQGMSTTNLTQQLEMQERGEMSQPICSYRSNIICNSSNLTTNSRNSTYKAKDLDNEDVFVRLPEQSSCKDNYSYGTSRCISLKSKNCLRDTEDKSETDTKSECDQRLQMWQIDPLASCVDENDVPLKKPNRPPVENRAPSKQGKDSPMSEMLEKLLPTLNIHSKQQVTKFHRNDHRMADSKFQWGSPIQVGLKDNVSNRKTKCEIEENEMESTNKHSNERPNKRKVPSILSAFELTNSSSDEDEMIFKKKKVQPRVDGSTILNSDKETKSVLNSETDKKFHTNDNNRSLSFYNKKEQSNATDYKSNTEQCSGNKSQTIVPSTVRQSSTKLEECNVKTSAKSFTIHVSDEEENVTTSRRQSNAIKYESSSKIKTPENIEIRPLPIKRLSHRIKNECKLLEKIQLEKQKSIELEKAEIEEKQNQERKKREEFYKRQIEERQRREKLREEKERHTEEQSKKWKNVVDAKKRINKDSIDKEKLEKACKRIERKITEVAEESGELQDTGTSSNMRTSVVKNVGTSKVNCPICNKLFSSSDVESHAAGCEEYVIENDYENNQSSCEKKASPININNSEILECGVCLKYKTINGNDYENHVYNCLENRLHEEGQNGDENNSVDNIINSPIRCYRPISELTDSQIDYKRQFPSNSKTQARSNRKRKR